MMRWGFYCQVQASQSVWNCSTLHHGPIQGDKFWKKQTSRRSKAQDSENWSEETSQRHQPRWLLLTRSLLELVFHRTQLWGSPSWRTSGPSSQKNLFTQRTANQGQVGASCWGHSEPCLCNTNDVWLQLNVTEQTNARLELRSCVRINDTQRQNWMYR